MAIWEKERELKELRQRLAELKAQCRPQALRCCGWLEQDVGYLKTERREESKTWGTCIFAHWTTPHVTHVHQNLTQTSSQEDLLDEEDDEQKGLEEAVRHYEKAAGLLRRQGSR